MSTLKRPAALPPVPRRAGAWSFECVLAADGRDAAWIGARGELDVGSAFRLELTLHDALDMARMVVLDLRELSFMDRTGLHLIIDTAARARHRDRRLVLIRGPAQVHQLFELVGVADRLEIVDMEPGGTWAAPGHGSDRAFSEPGPSVPRCPPGASQ